MPDHPRNSYISLAGNPYINPRISYIIKDTVIIPSHVFIPLPKERVQNLQSH